MKPMRLHHVGIVLPTVEKAHSLMEKIGLEVDYTGFVEAYHADLIFTKYKENESPLEFIIPKEGVLTEFNNGKGGIAHLAFEVDDVEAVRQEFEAKGLGMLEQHAVQGTSDIIVNFVRPKHTEGILVEFVQTVGEIKR
ncbi:MAG: VOC family protein [Sporomusaceae bacterium]|nr:VOC family protein [Sporomusaceae bacterium]